MKKTTKKTFKCSNCKNIFPILQKMITCEKIFDSRKYISKEGSNKCSIVCKRCFFKIKINNKMIRKGIKETMTGLKSQINTTTKLR